MGTIVESTYAWRGLVVLGTAGNEKAFAPFSTIWPESIDAFVIGLLWGVDMGSRSPHKQSRGSPPKRLPANRGVGGKP